MTDEGARGRPRTAVVIAVVGVLVAVVTLVLTENGQRRSHAESVRRGCVEAALMARSAVSKVEAIYLERGVKRGPDGAVQPSYWSPIDDAKDRITADCFAAGVVPGNSELGAQIETTGTMASIAWTFEDASSIGPRRGLPRAHDVYGALADYVLDLEDPPVWPLPIPARTSAPAYDGPKVNVGYVDEDGQPHGIPMPAETAPSQD